MIITINLDLFNLDIVKNVIYRNSGKYSFNLDIANKIVTLNIKLLDGSVIVDKDEVEREISRDLIDQSLRQSVREETKDIRKLIIAQAFSNTDLLDDE